MLVVRHAEAGDKSTWKGQDRLRPLSPRGHLQAEGLVFRLEDYPIERILCSPTLRCYQTVEPLARDRRLQIESVPALGVDTSPAQLLGDALLAEDPLDWPKGSTWLLERIDRRRVRGRFLAPLVHDQLQPQ